MKRDDEILLTVEEVRLRLGGNKSRRWVMDQARGGKLPCLKVGGEWRFHWPTILAKQRGVRAHE